MKKILLLKIILALLICKGYGQELSFQYDNAGNQTERKWICINCPPPYTTSNLVNKSTELKFKNNFEEGSELNRGLSAYPNPTLETLKLSWFNDDDDYIKSLAVFSLSGVKLISINCSKNQRETTISFIQYAAGTYLLKATYSSDREEIIKIIKQ